MTFFIHSLAVLFFMFMSFVCFFPHTYRHKHPCRRGAAGMKVRTKAGSKYRRSALGSITSKLFVCIAKSSTIADDARRLYFGDLRFRLYIHFSHNYLNSGCKGTTKI